MINQTIQLHPILADIKLVAIGQSQLKYTDNFQTVRPAIIICPGGGYLTIHDDEAEYVAMKFVSLGYMVFVLHYSVGAPYAYFPSPMRDLEQAIDYVYENASLYAIDQNNISLLGLSTGGHLVSTIRSNLKHKTNYKIKSKGLIYPVLSLTALLELKLKQENATLELMFSAIVGKSKPLKDQMLLWNSTQFIDESTPPTFICSYLDDAYCSSESLESYVAILNEKRIPNKVLLVSSKKHGNPTVDSSNNWVSAYHTWLTSF